MKKILSAILLIASIQSFGQTVQQIGGSKTKVFIPNQLEVDSLIILPATDTAIAPKVFGGFVLQSSDKRAYIYNGLKWVSTADGAVVTESDPTVSAAIKNASVADTTRWGKSYIDSVRRKPGSDSVFFYKDGLQVFGFRDSVQNVALKIDSVRRKSASDSVFYYASGVKYFAFRDSIGVGEITTGTPLGTGAQVFQAKVGVDFRFRSILSANGNLSITQNTNDLSFNSKSFIDSVRKKAGTDSVFFYRDNTAFFAFVDNSTAAGEVNTGSNTGTGVGVFKTKSGVDLQFKSLTSDTSVAITGNTNDVEIKVDQSRIASVKRLQDTAAALRVAAGSDQFVQVNVAGAYGAYSNFKYDYPKNRLRVDKIRLGLDHWTNERVNLTNYQEYVYGSSLVNFYDSLYNTHDEKITTFGDNLGLQNFKSTQVIVGYHKLGNTSTFPTDYQHNTFTQVLGGGFLNNASNGAQSVTLGSTAPNATTVSNHKFLIQGAGTRTITGWSSNMKQVTEVSSAGTAQNHADLNIGFMYRSGSGAGTGFTFTNKYGLYVNPIKDAGVTNAYGIYQEGASDLNYFGGNLYSKRYSQFGPTHWLTNGRIVAFVDDTLSGTNPTPNRAIMSDRTITLNDNTTLGGNSGNALLVTGYYRADANTILTSDYQANVFGTYSAGGFLNKSGVTTQNITSGNSATNAAVVTMNKLLYQNADSKVVTGFIGNHKSAWQISSGGSTENYSDLILGIKVRSGSGTSHTVSNHRAVHIIPVKDAATTNAYSIFQEGASDTNYFAGINRMPNVSFRSLDTTNFKIGVYDANGYMYKMYWPTFGGGGGLTGLSFNSSDSSLNYTFGGNTMVYGRTKSTVAGLNMRIGVSPTWNGVDTIATVSNPSFSAVTLGGADLQTTLNGKAGTSHIHTASNVTDFTSVARGVISLTTTGTSGAATYNSTTGVLNIPNYATGGGSGMVVGDAITGATANSILFAGAGNKLSQKNSDFYYDSTNRFMYISSTAGPAGIRMKTTSGGGYLDLRMDNDFGGDNVILRNMANSDAGKFHIVMTGTNRFTVQQNGNVGVGISSPSSLFHVVGSTRFDLGSDAAYDLYYRSVGGSLTRLPNGTTGQVLTASSGAAPSWSTLNTEGTYTPTYTGVTNIASTTAYVTYYSKVGNVVHVWGELNASATSAGVCELGMSIPVSSAFITTRDGNGTGSSDATSVRIFSDGTNDRMTLRWTAPNTTSTVIDFHFTYQVIPN